MNVIAKLIQLQSVVDFTFPERLLTKNTKGIMFILVGTFHQAYLFSVDVQSISIIVIENCSSFHIIYCIQCVVEVS